MIKSYLLFTTPTCPSCPNVKKFLAELERKGIIKGNSIELTSETGYEKAMTFGISRSPTVVLFDENRREVGRANNIFEIKSMVFDY